jgi:hypothetical protein
VTFVVPHRRNLALIFSSPLSLCPDRKSSYDMVKIGVWMFFYGKFVSPWAFFKTYLPFTILAFLFALLCGAFI